MTLKLKDGTTFEDAQCVHGGFVLSCRIPDCSIYRAAELFTEENCSEVTVSRPGKEDEVIEGYGLRKISIDGNNENSVSVNLKEVRK